MSARRATLGLAAGAAVVLTLLTGCSATVAMKPAAQATSVKCASVVAQLPDTVSTLAKRITNAQGTGAWGTPADILLRCGVPVPDPTSTLVCITVDGVDWLRNDKEAPVYVFTTYGRSPAVAVTINSKDVKADGNAALTDLSIAVASIKQKHKCVAPSEALEDGEPVSISTPTPTPTPASTATSIPTPKPTPTN
jgi:hypothetical protein